MIYAKRPVRQRNRAPAMQWAKPRQTSSTASEKRKRHKINIDFHVEPDLEDAGAETSTSASFPPTSELSDAGASNPRRRNVSEHLDSDNRRNEREPWESSDISQDQVSAWDYYGGSRQGNKDPWLSNAEDSSKYFGASDTERTAEDAVEPNEQQRPQHNRASWEYSPSYEEAADKTRWVQLTLPFLVVLVILGIAFASSLS